MNAKLMGQQIGVIIGLKAGNERTMKVRSEQYASAQMHSAHMELSRIHAADKARSDFHKRAAQEYRRHRGGSSNVVPHSLSDLRQADDEFRQGYTGLTH